MERTINLKQVYIAIICCLFITSCNRELPERKSLNKQKMDSKIKTIENMQSAYQGEKTATAKYLAFSKKAEEDGYHSIAVLYTAVSAAENIHAANHKMVIEDAGGSVPEIDPHYNVKSTKDNLFDDVNGEDYEAKIMYPDYLKTAESADNQIAILSLNYARKTEAKHKVFFSQALTDIENNTVNRIPSKYFVCPHCGNTYINAPGHCDFCLTPLIRFITFK